MEKRRFHFFAASPARQRTQTNRLGWSGCWKYRWKNAGSTFFAASPARQRTQTNRLCGGSGPKRIDWGDQIAGKNDGKTLVPLAVRTKISGKTLDPLWAGLLEQLKMRVPRLVLSPERCLKRPQIDTRWAPDGPQDGPQIYQSSPG